MEDGLLNRSIVVYNGGQLAVCVVVGEIKGGGVCSKCADNILDGLLYIGPCDLLGLSASSAKPIDNQQNVIRLRSDKRVEIGNVACSDH